MSTNQYKAAIIGCGGIFDVHVKALVSPALRDLGVEIAAVCDNKPERAEKAAADYNCRAYTDYKAMISEGGFDVLHICLPHHLHAPVAILAMENGINVLTEKPMATTVEDAAAMIDVSVKTGKKLGVIFQNRYNRGSVLVKNILEQGELGKIKSGCMRVAWHRGDEYYSESDWRGKWATEGGGVLINQSIHTFDLMNYFLGVPVAVDANIANRAHPNIEVEDMAEGVITYADGISVSFYVTTYHPYNAPIEIDILGELGRAVIRGSSGEIHFKDGRKLTSAEDMQATPAVGKDYWGNSHGSQILEYYKSLAADRKPEICGDEGIISQKLINAIYRSAKAGKRVEV